MGSGFPQAAGAPYRGYPAISAPSLPPRQN